MKQGNLFVISGPSGVGKGTLVARIVELMPDDVWLSVSATTRKPRKGEQEGVSYFFLTVEEFEALIEDDGFLEWARYNDNYYGTPKASVLEYMAAGKNVLLEIETQGALQVKEKMPEACTIFIEPPSLEELERRLTKRGTETSDVIMRRLEIAKVELSKKMEYDIRLVNDDLDEATKRLATIIRSYGNTTLTDDENDIK